MEIENGTGEGGGGRPVRSRCYSLLLFLLDLVLVTLFVPRRTQMTIRLVALLALRALITTLATATNVGIYQAFLYNAGRTTEETQLASSINTLFGVTPVTCERTKRDTWATLLDSLDKKPAFTTLRTPKETKKQSELRFLLKENLTNIIATPTTSSAIKVTRPSTIPTLASSTMATTTTTLSSTSSTTNLPALLSEDVITEGAVIPPRTCLDSLQVLAALIFFALTAIMNLSLLGCLFRKMNQLRTKEDQLRGSFDALQRLYAAGRLLENVDVE